MKILGESLKATKTGYGTFSISVEIDGKKYLSQTTNTMAIDAAFDRSYNPTDNDYYSSIEEARNELIEEILMRNDLTL